MVVIDIMKRMKMGNNSMNAMACGPLRTRWNGCDVKGQVNFPG